MTTSSEPPVFFHYNNTVFSLKDRKKLKRFIALLLKENKKSLGALSYIFTTDREVLRINREYLKHNFYTDVITFDLSESRQEMRGEVYISIDRVKDNAKAFNVSFSEELHRVIFHAALHLCGFDDKTARK